MCEMLILECRSTAMAPYRCNMCLHVTPAFGSMCTPKATHQIQNVYPLTRTCDGPRQVSPRCPVHIATYCRPALLSGRPPCSWGWGQLHCPEGRACLTCHCLPESTPGAGLLQTARVHYRQHCQGILGFHKATINIVIFITTIGIPLTITILNPFSQYVYAHFCSTTYFYLLTIHECWHVYYANS